MAKSRYTYDQFRKSAQDSGLWGQFSQADLSMAQQNPDFGMSILKTKQDYRNATTDEARAAAHRQADALRSSWGGYTGGGNGGSFVLDPMSPRNFEYEEAPTYESRYDDTIQDLIAGLLDRPDFSYDPATDPLYQNYRKQYTREGQRATADALGAAAAASGGIPSSYANAAANQASNYYAAQLTDKIPDLYQLAYNQYLNDYNMDLSNLGVVQGAEQSDYDKYLNQLNQYNTDRNFSYGQFLDELSSQNQRRTDALNEAVLRAEMGDYGGYESLGWDTSNIPAEIERQLTLAQLGAQYGDYSGLNGLGIDTSNNPTDYERRYNLALLQAQYGDFSGLRELGVNVNPGALAQFELAANPPRSSGGSGSSRSGRSSGTSGTEKPVLTYTQMMDAIEKKQITPTVKAAWQYYMGEAWPEDNTSGDSGGTQLNPYAQQLQNSLLQGGAGIINMWPGTTQQVNKSSSGLSPAAQSILNSYQHVNPGTSSNVAEVFADRIETALRNGSITEQDASYLLGVLGV